MPEINIKLEPFAVPNFVRMQLPITQSRTDPVDVPGIPLANLSSEVLEQMCDDFRSAVFRKAGKPRPPLHA